MSNQLQISQELHQYDEVRMLAQAIGLSKYKIFPSSQSKYINNMPSKRQRPRTNSRSEMKRYVRAHSSQKVRDTKQSKINQDSQQRIRKNSTKSVFVRTQKPYDNPLIWKKTIQQIQNNKQHRTKKILSQNQYLNALKWQKKRRSVILQEVSDDLVYYPLFSYNSQRISTPSHLNRSVLNKKSNPISFTKSMPKPHSNSFQKLALSFNLSRFSSREKEGEVYVSSRIDRKKVQTARSGKKSLRLRMNSKKNVFQMYQADKQSQVAVWPPQL